MLIRPRQQQLVRIQRVRLPSASTSSTANGTPRNVAASTNGVTGTDRSNRNTVNHGPIASYSDRPSRSQTCGTRQPGTVDGVKSYIV